MHKLTKNKLFVLSNFSNAETSSGSTLADLQKKQSDLNENCPSLWAEFERINTLINRLSAEIGGANISAAALQSREQARGRAQACSTELATVNQQIKSMLALQEAQIAEQLAMANLTPAERAALEKQKADLELERQRQELMNDKSERISKNTKLLIIGVVVFLVFAGLGLMVYEIKKGNKVAAAVKAAA